MLQFIAYGVASYLGFKVVENLRTAKTLGTVGGATGVPRTTLLLAKRGTLGTVKLGVGDAVAIEPPPNVPSFDAQIGLNAGHGGPALAKAPFDPVAALGIPVGSIAFVASAKGDSILNYYFTDPNGHTSTGSVHISVR